MRLGLRHTERKQPARTTVPSPHNQLVNTDALRRPLAPRAPFASRRLHARYMAWGQFSQREQPQSSGRARQFVAVAGQHLTRRGAISIVGTRVRWRARVTSRATAGQLRQACLKVRPRRSTSCSLVEATPPFTCMHSVGTTTAAYNMAIDTDAQGRPRAARAPFLGRRSSPR
jgi:hypothetical protein